MISRVLMRKIPVVLAALSLVVACGGSSATPSPTAVPATVHPSTNPVQEATSALKSEHDAWQFTLTTYEPGSPNFSRTVTGTQTAKLPTAVSFTVVQSGKPDMRYVRVGTDVWNDTGAGSFTKTKASDAYVNLAFQTFYLDSILSEAATAGYEFDKVGAETVSGIAATHYRLADNFVQGLVANTGTAAADWAADVWIADSDGSLVRLTWGPQSIDNVQDQTGFDYLVTSVDCNCPIGPPIDGQS